MAVQQQTQNGIGRTIKRGLTKIILGAAIIYSAGVAIDYHFTSNRLIKEHDKLKTEEVTSLINNDHAKYLQLEQKVVALEKEQDKILFSHSAAWPYSVGKSAYEWGQKKFK